jgi:hypothetical protein
MLSGSTVIVSVVDPVVNPVDAVIVTVGVPMAVGVPEITPVELHTNPDGSPDAANEIIGRPDNVVAES